MFTMELAGHAVCVDNQYDYIHRLCKDYLTEKKEEFCVCATKEEILAENPKGESWPPDYLESLAVYRKICHSLLEKQIILFHCSALEMDGEAYLFAAPSGTGKSTHAGLWRSVFGDKVTMINDDKPLLKIGQSDVVVYGTPYGGKNGIQKNTCAKVKAIFILHQAPENTVKQMSSEEAFPKLLSQTYRRKDAKGMLCTVELVRKLAGLPVFSLGCTISEEAVWTAYEAVKKL